MGFAEEIFDQHIALMHESRDALCGAYPEIVRPDDCAYCGTCEETCPSGAIVLVYEIVAPEVDPDASVQ
ncbi:MAG: 4Fe-4S binding protein [Anaerolineae bacterium]